MRKLNKDKDTILKSDVVMKSHKLVNQNLNREIHVARTIDKIVNENSEIEYVWDYKAFIYSVNNSKLRLLNTINGLTWNECIDPCELIKKCNTSKKVINNYKTYIYK